MYEAVANNEGSNFATSSGFRWFTMLRNHAKAGLSYTSEWCSPDDKQWRQTKPDALEESSYTDGVDANYNIKEDLLEITIWNCGNFDGHRENRRCKFLIKDASRQEAFESSLDDIITNRLSKIACCIYEARLEQERRKAIDEIIKQLIS